MIGLISINFKTSPIEVREAFYFQEKEKEDFFNLLSSECPVDGLIILSTCNRTELYYEFENHLGEEKKIFHLIMTCLVKFKHYSEGLSPYVATKNGSYDVSKHLFRLISGLESMIIGEFQIVDQLKPKYRDLVKLRYFKEMKYDEIAKNLDLPIGTVKAQLHRSREQLFKILSGSRDSF